MTAEQGEYVNAYVDGPDLVLLRREGERLLRRSVRAEWVSYFKVADVPLKLRRDLGASQYVRSIKQEGEWLRVGWSDPLIREAMCGLARRRGNDAPQSPIVAASIPTYEADVTPARRWFTDTGVGIQRPRRCWIDIETDSRVPFSRKEEARILSWVVTDDDEQVVGEGVLAEDSNPAERDLVYAMWATLLRYDQALAWSGDGFDFPVIDGRTERLDVKVDGRSLLRADYLDVFEKMNRNSAESGEEKRSMKLNSIAVALKVGEKDRFDSSRTWEAWSNASPCSSGACMACRSCLLRYNRQDTRLLPRIEKKVGFGDVFVEVARACRLFPDTRALDPTRQLDGFMLRLGAEKGVHFPTRVRRESAQQFKGAFVMEPTFKGIARNVHVSDFSGMYPSIILTWNMSPETKVAGPVNGPIPEGMCRSPLTGACFSTREEGMLSIAVSAILERRKHWNDKKASLPPNTPEWVDADRISTGYKVIANGFFGVVGSPWSRFYDPIIGEAITQCGKWLIQQTNHAAEQRGMIAGYSDTDSSFISQVSKEAFSDFVAWCNAELYPRLLASVGCSNNLIKLAYEKEFDRLVFLGKKRYVGRFRHYKGKLATAETKPEVKGLEYKRGDAALLAARMQSEVIHLLMGVGDEGLDPAPYHDLVLRWRRRVLQDPLAPEEVVVSQSLTKPLAQYKARAKKDGADGSDLAHVAVARVLVERGREVREGTRIEYFVVDGSTSPNTVAPAEDYGRSDVDRYYLWESKIYPPTQRLLEAAFPRDDWAQYLRVRPARARGGRGRTLPGQLGLDVRGGSAPPVAPLEILVEEHMAAAVAEVLARHRGTRPAQVRMWLPSGQVAVAGAVHHVSDGELLREELAAVLFAAT